ncbi:MAG TPA: glutaminyl-peptide cyclotransferase [Pyrinomonadaceae bacterium]|jgi:glutamine cyclotransferase|nr:glutaminyl-peptide cyclotransferase [Pyrinomonadaceae bacterium]
MTRERKAHDSQIEFHADSVLDDTRCSLRTSQYEVIACWPHCTDASTEGLEIYNGVLYESTGPNPPPSRIRRIGLRSGIVMEDIPLATSYFAEGITVLNGRLFQLTLDSGFGFIYDTNKLSNPPKTFKYNGWDYGWGITNDGIELIISDSTANLHYVDPVTFTINRSITVQDNSGTAQDSLNELEFFDGAIYANIHDFDRVVRIDPVSGQIADQIDLSGLRQPNCGLCELNGIAYDRTSNHVFVTGKNWSKVFEIRLL